MNANHIELQKYLNNLAQELRNNGSQIVLTTELEQWISYGINSVEEFEHSDAQSEHYELYEEINGISPRWFAYSEMTTQEIREQIKILENEYAEILVREKERKDAESRLIQQRKAKNAYKPNLLFANLKDMI